MMQKARLLDKGILVKYVVVLHQRTGRGKK